MDFGVPKMSQEEFMRSMQGGGSDKNQEGDQDGDEDDVMFMNMDDFKRKLDMMNNIPNL